MEYQDDVCSRVYDKPIWTKTPYDNNFLVWAVEQNFIEHIIHAKKQNSFNVFDSDMASKLLPHARSAEMVNALVFDCHANVNFIRSNFISDGVQPIHKATSFEVANALVSYGADIDSQCCGGLTPLMCYLEQMSMDDIFLVVENLMPKNISKFLPLSYAVKLANRHAACVRSVLFWIKCNVLGQKDVTKMIALLLWKTRRNPIWEKEIQTNL